MKISKNRYLQVFCLVVIVLGIVRAVFPRVAMSEADKAAEKAERTTLNIEKSPEEAEKIVPAGEIRPEAVITPHVFVSHIYQSTNNLQKVRE